MNLASLRVMIVDDDVSTLELYRALLQEQGHTVLLRDRALGTAPAIITAQPDVVLLDINMPGLRGTEIVRVFNERHQGTSPLFILFAGQPPEILQEEAHRCGAAAGLSKLLPPRDFMVGFRTVVVRHLAALAAGSSPPSGV